MGTFVVYIDNAGEFRWYLLAANNRKIADAAEGYQTRQDCEDAIRLMKRLRTQSEYRGAEEGRDADRVVG